MSNTSAQLAGAGATVALGSAAVGALVPITAPVAAVGVSAGLAAAAVGGVGTIVGGATTWVGGILSGNSNAAGYGFMTATVNAALTVVDFPPLPCAAPDPAEMVASAAGLTPPTVSASTCP